MGFRKFASVNFVGCRDGENNTGFQANVAWVAAVIPRSDLLKEWGMAETSSSTTDAVREEIFAARDQTRGRTELNEGPFKVGRRSTMH